MMRSTSRPLDPHAPRPGAALAAGMAIILWPTLAFEMIQSVATTRASGKSLPELIFLFFHFFSILTNIGIAVLMSATALKLMRNRPLPSATTYNFALIYILVTCITYELLLRRLYSPQDLRAITNAIIHDVIPGLTLIFWLVYAPRDGTRWTDALWVLAYPAIYLAATLVAGALGQPYPYSFLDVDRLGGERVAMVAGGFLIVFYVLGLVATAICKFSAGVRGDPSPVV